MSKYLRDIQIYSSYSDDEHINSLPLTTNFLEILYLDSLPKVETYGVPKVTIKPCERLAKSRLDVVLRNPEILQLSKPFNFDAYWKSDKETRKQIALDFLQEGLLQVAKIRGWDAKPFREAYKTVLAKKFVNYRPWSKAVISPDRKYKAQVWCNYDSDRAEIFVVIFHHREVHTKTLAAVVQPGDVWIREVDGKLEWISQNEVKLVSRDGKKSWKVKIERP